MSQRYHGENAALKNEKLRKVGRKRTDWKIIAASSKESLGKEKAVVTAQKGQPGKPAGSCLKTAFYHGLLFTPYHVDQLFFFHAFLLETFIPRTTIYSRGIGKNINIVSFDFFFF
jgi:hypothetical protein